jgi:hypothetical protein
MVVAFHVPHNEGVIYGIFTKPDMDTNLTLVDLYEVDGRLRTFENVEQAQGWLNGYKSVNRQGEVKPDILYDIPMDELWEARLCADTGPVSAS